MADDALAWWSALDEEVQGSWKLLRQAMLSTYRPMFCGGSGEEAERFIRAVRDQAINERKRTDNEWIVMYAESCLAGEALRWYTYLDLDTKNNWEKLQQALLTQYPRRGPGDPALNLIPTPAAAASAAPAPIRNRVVSSASLADALELEWIPASYGLQTLSIPESQVPGCDSLGMKWYPNDPPGQYNVLWLCAVDSHTNSTALDEAQGTLLTNNWKMSIGNKASHEIVTVSAMAGSGAVRILTLWHAVSYWANFRYPKELLYSRWSCSGGGVWFTTGNSYRESSAEFFFEPI
ncbi:hypothetical protein M407DRAFT_34543 [Tulasnella calospora MUT 4182]|uniref:Retrotransposon gag domain-containing protein n=1 Tax=Tulasnella calospora MUT 4182 TaxID=1051891 RepID=A0A0C3Q154_9AGAM|nr:hypothetical protein M407DRAFT_34543 [Tulasnella calospora MUT 4182]